MQPHDEEGGEDDVGEEGDEVNHFPVGLEETEKYFSNDQMEPLKLVMKVIKVLSHLHPFDEGDGHKSPGESKTPDHLVLSTHSKVSPFHSSQVRHQNRKKNGIKIGRSSYFDAILL